MIYFGYGVMGAAKTLNALKIVFDYETNGKKVLLLSNTSLVESRVGWKHKAICFDNIIPSDFDDMMRVQKYDAIVIDEVQFCPIGLLVHIILGYKDEHIYCYGLYNTSDQDVFESSKYVRENADIVQEFYSVCKCCNNLARKHAAVIKDENGQMAIVLRMQNITLPKDSYVSLCEECYEKLPKRYGNGQK
ncbi:MAG: hypothetical protein II399_00915 [Lachnospiraceae bacterium]|nr:hypothetical protein [Lachnospiraceae bacterium]